MRPHRKLCTGKKYRLSYIRGSSKEIFLFYESKVHIERSTEMKATANLGNFQSDRALLAVGSMITIYGNNPLSEQNIFKAKTRRCGDERRRRRGAAQWNDRRTLAKATRVLGEEKRTWTMGKESPAVAGPSRRPGTGRTARQQRRQAGSDLSSGTATAMAPSPAPATRSPPPPAPKEERPKNSK